MLKFPYPVKFVAANKREFNIRITKPNKRSWWLQLLDDNNKPIKTIKVSKTSVKLRYPAKNGGTIDGPTILRTLVKEDRLRLQGVRDSASDRQTSRQSQTSRQ